MADEEKKKGSPFEMLWIFLAFMGGLIILWFISGGPERADLRGIFLAPPPPLGPGDAYGPQVGTTSQYYQDNYGN